MKEALAEIKAVRKDPVLAAGGAVRSLRAADRAWDRDGALAAMATLVDPAVGATNWAGDSPRRLLASKE